MRNRTAIIVVGILIALNVIAGVVWIEACYVIPLNRASNRHGSVREYEERIALMHADMNADRQRAFPFFLAFATVTGVNAVLGTAIVFQVIRNRSSAETLPQCDQ